MAQQTDHIGDTNKMVTMKLYTEEQVKEMIDDAHNGIDGYYDIFKWHTPIELPSDEEIYTVAKDKIDLSNDCFGQYDFTSGKQDGFYEGAIWMRDKIQGGKK